MRRFYLVLTVLMILVGLVHAGSTFALFDGLDTRAVWFASGGLAMILTGLINLLNQFYGDSAPGVRWTAIVANGLMTVFAAWAGIAEAASSAQQVLIVGLMAVTTLLSWWLPSVSE